ncbi:hypothetical protein WJX77_009653 [Trebouxia sp. C0004]
MVPSARKEHSRLIQKRYRQRQKARSQTVESQLAQTTAELASLKARQHHLEQGQQQLQQRNVLLERMAKLKSQTSTEVSQPAQNVNAKLQTALQADVERTLAGVTSSSDRGQVLTLTVDEIRHVLTVEEIGQVSMSDCREMYTMYARKLGECLLRLGDAGEDHEAAAADLHRWIVELTSLGTCIMYGHPHLLKAIQSSSLDHTQAPVQELSDMFYADVLSAVNLSEAQVRDFLHLRHCFWGKIGQLERTHQQIIGRLSSGTASNPHVSDKLAEVTSLTEQLHANGSEEYRTHMQLASAMFRGILTSKQLAIQVVHAYPWLLDKPRLLDVLAASRGELTAQALKDSARLDDVQLAANWQEIEQYLTCFSAQDLQRHVPLLKTA